ncbi:hypothetical protein HYT56_05900, partial [Candidatus Woesearchaeota archaeon]|nr:hypothetical protein [Candidatus Woesearchaeota archaeon]
NLDGNLIIEDTGLINLTADTCSGSCPGGNLTIDAAGVINVTGNITADAGLYTGVNFNSVGGNIYINSSSMFIETNAVISASSDYLTSSANDYSGDKAGIIIINSTGSVENLGTIQVIGGNADTNDCSIGGDARGRRGDGGNINITGTEITNNGLINVEKGLLGQCLTNGLVVNDAQDGLIYLNDTFSPCNNGTIFDPGSCVISKPIRVPHNEIINFSGYNWTLGNGAWLNGDADYSEDTAALTVNATDFTLIVDILNLSGGNITSYGTLHSASGGTIIINASQIFINENSKISASAEDISLTVSLDRPQAYGGTINLTASIINSTGKITTNGKNGDIDDCIPGSRGPSGDGGNIFIDADEVVVEELSVRRGIGDLCDLGLGGIIEVNATTSFTGTGLISAYGNYSGNITIISPSIDINSTINTTSPDTIVNGTTILDFSNFINLSSAVIEPGPILIRNTTEGRIEYLERVGDSVTSLTDLNMSMNISINLIEVDGESGDAALNRTAEIWIYNSSFISFDDTLILKDGANCTDCNKISYDQVTYIFNVSSFTNYSILDAIPTTPVLTSPENDSLIGSIYPRLKWENTSDPDDTTTYYLEVYNDSDLTLLVYNNPAVPDSDNPVEDQINISLEDGDYFWRVLATGALENGTVYNSSYSELWTFTVNASSSTFRQNANGTEIKDRFEYGTFVQTNLTTFGD